MVERGWGGWPPALISPFTRSVALSYLLSHAMRDVFDVDVDLVHASSPNWSKRSCGLGNGCADCESDADKRPFVEVVIGLLRDALNRA